MNLKTQSEILYGRIGWIKNDDKKNKLMVIYFLYNLVRFTANLILQCVFLDSQGSIKEQSGNSEVSRRIEARSKWIEDLMISIGQVHRANGATAIFFYSILISNILTYRLSILLFEDTFDFFTKNEFLLLLAKPIEGKRIFIGRLNNCLDQMIKSNENFTKKIINRVSIDETSRPKPASSDSFFDLNSFSRRHILIVPCSHTSYEMKFTSSIDRITGNFGISKKSNSDWDDKESIDFEMLSAEVELIEALHKQHEYLIKLKLNIDNVWPAFRDTDFIDSLKRIGRFAYLIYGVLGWLSGQLITFAASNMAYSSLSSNSKYGQRFTFLDRLQCAEYQIFAYFVMFAFIPDFCVYLTTNIYLFLQLKRLQYKTNQFYGEIKRCEDWQQASNNQCLKEDGFISHEQTKRDLKFECDKSLIELYMNYSVFRKEVYSAVRTLGKPANQILVFVAIAILPVLAYFKYIPKAHRSSIVTVVLLNTMIINIPFLLSAFFNSACDRFVKHSWSIVAFLAGHNYELYLSSRRRVSTNILKKRNNDDSSGFYHSNISLRRGIYMIPDYVYHSKSFITPHTAILWHSLIGSHKAVSDGFVSKIFGHFKINHGGVLRFNHYVVWISLVIILNQKSSITS